MITLRPDQAQLKQGVYNSWSSGKQNVCAVLPTGGGKSVIVTDVVLDRDQQNAKQLVMAHRNELVGQMSMHVARRGIKHRIVASKQTIAQIIQEHRAEFQGRSFVNPDANCSVASVQTINARKTELKQWAAQLDDWTLDECFVAGTMIDTPNGPVAIENIRVGDVVTSWDEVNDVFVDRKVMRLFKNPLPSTIIDISICGRNVRCTPNHPFWTDRGWVDAGELRADDDLYVDMRGMREAVHYREGTHCVSGAEAWSGVLRHILRHEIQRPTSCAESTVTTTSERVSSLFDTPYSQACENMLVGMRVENPLANHGSNEPHVCFRANEAKQSDGARGNPCESFFDIKNYEAHASEAGWERQVSAGGGSEIEHGVSTAGVCSTIFNSYGNEERRGLSPLLQTRFSASAPDDSDRSGWKITSNADAKIPGREKGSFFTMQRVDHIEVHQRADIERDTDGFVYNFEVDEHHTYIANGIVTHNCHHLLRNNMWGDVVGLFPNARGLGVTACPSRADGAGLGRDADGLFDDMVVGESMRWLIDNRALSDWEIVCPTSDLEIDESAITGTGDFSPNKMREASKRSHIVGDVVQEYCKWAFGKRTIVFAIDIDDANKIANGLNDIGIPAAAVSSKTPAATRNEYIKRFKAGKIWVLINVDLFDEGFDVPACECVILARPTASLNKYLQMCGRAMRIDPTNPSKVALIIDMVSNWKRHGFPDKIRQWTLDRREKRAKKAPDPDDIPLTSCRECARPYERFHVCCPYCGAMPPVPDGGGRSVQQVDGDLVLLDRDTLAAMRAATELESPAAVEDRVTYAAGPIAGKGAANRQIEKIQAQQALADEIAQWAGYQRQMGRQDREGYKRFYLATGMDVLSALSQDKKDMLAMCDIVKGWNEKCQNQV